jgi:hypothetical protein
MQMDKLRRSVHMIDGRKTPYNCTYPKCGVSCSADTFVVAESSVLRMKFSGKNPALRVAAKRWRQGTND